MTSDVAGKITELVNRMFGHMNLACTVSVQNHEGVPITVDIESSEASKLLIGKNGQNLHALEQVIRAMLFRHGIEHRAVVVDVNGYRKEKTEALVSLVRQTAEKVRNTGRSEALDPMSAHERRIVHTELATHHDLATESVGQEPQRRVVIRLL